MSGHRAPAPQARFARSLAAPNRRSGRPPRTRTRPTPWRKHRLPGLTAALLATLLTSTIALTMDRSVEDFVTLALHYPLFLVIALSSLVHVPRRWRTVLCLAALPLLAIEVAAMRVL